MIPGETVLSGCTLATVEDFQVCQSAAGYYVGTWHPEFGPTTRETGYWKTREEAQKALDKFKETGILDKVRG